MAGKYFHKHPSEVDPRHLLEFMALEVVLREEEAEEMARYEQSIR